MEKMNLFQGEKIKFTHLGLPSKKELTDDEINEKYIQGDVRIITEQARYPLSSIELMLSSGNYKLNPEFQRRHRWDINQKSMLIESFIMNVPIPPVFLYEDSYSHYEVMDGLQRLTAIKEFYQNDYALDGLEEWPELNGKKYSELPFQIKRGIDRRYLSSIILLHETAKSEKDAVRLKQLVFERINSGGVKLEPQESRNAVYNGPLNELCIKLARNKYFCKMWGIPEQTKEEVSNTELIQNKLYKNMGDVELVLRFFANRQRSELTKYTSSFKEYLNNFLNYGNSLPSNTLTQLEKLFEETLEFLYSLLGESSFYLYRLRNDKWSWYNRPTTAIYDPLTLVASEFLDNKAEILTHKKNIKSIFEIFYKENYSSFEGRNTNSGVVSIRIELLRKLFKSLID